MDDIKQKRADAWENCLTEEQQRELYRWVKAPFEDETGNTRLHTFDECMQHLDELGVKRPSRPAWYRFKVRMEKDRRLEMLYSIQGSGESAKDLTAMTPADYAVAADAFTNLAIDAAMKGCEKAVGIYSAAARHYREMLQADKKLDLQSRAQQTKEADLELAQRKFEDEQTRRTAAEARADKAEQIAKALQEKVKELEKALKDAGKVNVVDTSKVMDELDKLLGMKK